jgi:hypothetical protein
MTNKILVSILVVLASPYVSAAVSFQCYADPSIPVMAYEYASGSCAGFDSKAQAAKVGKNGEKDMVCLYSGVCEAVDGARLNQPPSKRTLQEISARQVAGHLKNSLIICKGKGKIEDGIVNTADCPDPSACAADTFYNTRAARMPPAIPDPVTIRAQPESNVR